tara:strand:+ start:232 stop:414 length:183 start_codon:yes stop_codon:yes gene_type:complete
MLVRPEQPRNILAIFETEDVSKLLTSRDVRVLASRNILDITELEDVLKLLRSKDVRLLQM